MRQRHVIALETRREDLPLDLTRLALETRSERLALRLDLETKAFEAQKLNVTEVRDLHLSLRQR